MTTPFTPAMARRIELWPLALPQDEGEPESEADVADGPWRAPG